MKKINFVSILILSFLLLSGCKSKSMGVHDQTKSDSSSIIKKDKRENLNIDEHTGESVSINDYHFDEDNNLSTYSDYDFESGEQFCSFSNSLKGYTLGSNNELVGKTINLDMSYNWEIKLDSGRRYTATSAQDFGGKIKIMFYLPNAYKEIFDKLMNKHHVKVEITYTNYDVSREKYFVICKLSKD